MIIDSSCATPQVDLNKGILAFLELSIRRAWRAGNVWSNQAKAKFNRWVICRVFGDHRHISRQSPNCRLVIGDGVDDAVVSNAVLIGITQNQPAECRDGRDLKIFRTFNQAIVSNDDVAECKQIEKISAIGIESRIAEIFRW